MRKWLAWLVVMIAASIPVQAQTRQTMSMISEAVNCLTTACTATSAQFCQQSDRTKLYACDPVSGFYVLFGGSADAVLGPASSIDNAIARYDGTTGKLIQGYTSGAPTIDDTGGMTLAGNVTLSMGGATVDGKDISGQGAFKNESNAFLEDQSVASGKKIGYEGAAGDTYTLRDIDRAALETTVDGTIATRTEADNWRPPPCPANLNDVPFGGICTEAATGKIRFRGTLEAIP